MCAIDGRTGYAVPEALRRRWRCPVVPPWARWGACVALSRIPMGPWQALSEQGSQLTGKRPAEKRGSPAELPAVTQPVTTRSVVARRTATRPVTMATTGGSNFDKAKRCGYTVYNNRDTFLGARLLR